MVGLGQLSPIEEARARLQEKIAEFLAGRARLKRLMNSPSLQVKSQAEGLYKVQVELENQLQGEIIPKIQGISSGAWAISDVLVIGSFTSLIIKQINDVAKLESAAGVVAPSGGFNFDLNTVMIGAGVLLVFGVASGMLFGRKR